MNKLELNKVYQGNSLDVLKTFPDESIDMCITSPPYWGLRDYGVDNQLGLEKTPEEFVDKLCDVFDEVKRVLKPHGSCWVNLGDSYANSGVMGDVGEQPRAAKGLAAGRAPTPKGVKTKSLVMIPSRFAIEMIDRGWILRNEIIWHKPTCMPSPAKDRYTVDFEKMFFFTKNKKYYFKQQIEPVKEASLKRAEYGLNQTDNSQKAVNVQNMEKMGTRFVNPKGRNKRTVWSVNPASFKDAHFATYPPQLIESPIDACCPEFVDKKTGKPRERVVEHITLERYELPKDNPKYRPKRYEGKYEQGMRHALYNDKGYDDGRDNDEFTSGIVLDPFFGSGTTAEVAMKQDKDWVGIELNPEYEKISQKRLKPTIVKKKTREKASEFWDIR